MKRFFLFILVLLLFPFSSFSESADPIVGCWYLFFDCKELNEIIPESFDKDYTYALIMLVFNENGNILGTEIEYTLSTGKSGNTAYLGKWEKDGSNYKTSFFANGVEKAWFEDDLLYICILNSSQYYGFHKMQTLDLYNNIYNK